MPLGISYHAMLVNFELTNIVIPAVHIIIVHKLKLCGHIIQCTLNYYNDYLRTHSYCPLPLIPLTVTRLIQAINNQLVRASPNIRFDVHISFLSSVVIKRE